MAPVPQRRLPGGLRAAVPLHLPLLLHPPRLPALPAGPHQQHPVQVGPPPRDPGQEARGPQERGLAVAGRARGQRGPLMPGGGSRGRQVGSWVSTSPIPWGCGQRGCGGGGAGSRGTAGGGAGLGPPNTPTASGLGQGGKARWQRLDVPWPFLSCLSSPPTSTPSCRAPYRELTEDPSPSLLPRGAGLHPAS